MPLRRQTTRVIDYDFLILRNQLHRVTLNDKVKLKFALIVSVRIVEYVHYGT